MRILFISNSLRRHVYTLLRLAIAAQETGHDVVFATGADLAPAVEDRGIFAWAVGLDHLQLCAVPNSWFGYFELAAERRAHQVITRARAWKPDLVVHEETELSGVLVAAVTGARQVVHGVGPMPSRKVRDLLSQAGERLGRR